MNTCEQIFALYVMFGIKVQSENEELNKELNSIYNSIDDNREEINKRISNEMGKAIIAPTPFKKNNNKRRKKYE